MAIETSPIVCRRLVVSGQVQGVGFRPFVYRLAHSFGLHGWVRNDVGEVSVLVQGDADSVAAFVSALTDQAPPLARPKLRADASSAPQHTTQFEILPSAVTANAQIHIPPDYFACDDCLTELRDPVDRRSRYPFINCTQCGPRYTLIAAMPYDRPNTSMAGFAMCPACESEYRDPLNRRFHAEPVACPICGPKIWLQHAGHETCGPATSVLESAKRLLLDGAIIAVRGIGGYHLMCDASNEQAVSNLRNRKHRPHKPLAIMFPECGADRLAAIREHCVPNTVEEKLICSPGRPIVLVQKGAKSSLAKTIAPDLNELGVFLPYTPLHAILLDDFGGPLVATSANISGEPVLTSIGEAQKKLAKIADAFVHHDRPILRPADDPVYRYIGKKTRPLRLGRGNAPLELDLPVQIDTPTIAVGAHMKNTIALAWDKRIVVSPHIGEMDTPRSLEVFTRLITDLQELYSVTATDVVCDRHPGYTTTRWAMDSNLRIHRVQHHHAHASAAYLDAAIRGNAIAFCWDGVGFGDDGALWGGETFVGRPGAWKRCATLRSFRLCGAGHAGREPWRSALGVMWEAGLNYAPPPQADRELLEHAWQNDINTHSTTAAGRLFDAAAAMVLGIESCSFEAQGPMQLEAIYTENARFPRLTTTQRDDGLLVVDWAPLLPELNRNDIDAGARSGLFHASLADAIGQVANRMSQETEVCDILLTGGVFQNKRLTELAVRGLAQHSMNVHLSHSLPCNDAAISAGQIVEVAHADNCAINNDL